MTDSFEVMRARILYSKGRPEAPPVPVETMRCESCHGLFPAGSLESHVVPLIFPANDRILLAICRTCHERFHTEFSRQHESSST